MATSKSDVQGGHRSKVRHASEIGAGGALALLLVSLIPDGVFDAFQSNMASVVLTGAFSTASKFANEGGIGKLAKIVGIGSLVLFLSGCGISMGRVTPMEFTGHQGETIISCKLEGVQFGIFDGGVCRNVEGGQVGQTTVDLMLGLGKITMAAIAGFFTGLGGGGAGMTAAIADVDVSPPPPTAPVVEGTPVVGEFFE